MAQDLLPLVSAVVGGTAVKLLDLVSGAVVRRRSGLSAQLERLESSLVEVREHVATLQGLIAGTEAVVEALADRLGWPRTPSQENRRPPRWF